MGSIFPASDSSGAMYYYQMLATGVCFRRSMVRVRDIKDGTSNTYMAGEKYMNPDHYCDGVSVGDDQSWDASFCYDAIRWSGMTLQSQSGSGWVVTGMASKTLAPSPDIPGMEQNQLFGSAHLDGFGMVFCDGSVHSISYSISPEVHHRLGNIADGLPIGANAF